MLYDLQVAATEEVPFVLLNGLRVSTLRTEAAMSLETLLLWIVVGLVAGWLASVVVGGGYGLVGDIIVGVVGSFIGGFIFHGLHLHSPFGGLAGTIFVAFIGAVVLLVIIRLIRSAGARGRF
jgi:uncharacterized membrane protein YeaQ/YmgE (transglycosylase-associated protein family)